MRAPRSTRRAPADDRFGDVVIDLTDPTPTTRTVRPPARGRGWGVWVPVVVLLGVGVAVGALAVANYSAALQWRERANVAEQRAAQAEAQAAASRRDAQEARRAQRVARQRRSALADQLAVSEADVAALEARLVALASDRAREQDLGGAVGGTDPEALLRSLGAQVDSCVAQVAAARSGLITDTDVDGWQRALTVAEATCAQAASDIDALAGGD
ncbi:MAG TPA: hypothetical protein VK923_06685 [Euzebyales bacterium]|nr:hypothetical protein [Euzebyales bacterium]